MLDLRRWWKLKLREPCLNELKFLLWIGVPVKKQIDLRRTARSFRLDRLDSRNAVHRLLDRTRHADKHLIGRNLAVIDNNDDARKICVGKYRRRKLPRRQNSRNTQN